MTAHADLTWDELDRLVDADTLKLRDVAWAEITWLRAQLHRGVQAVTIHMDCYDAIELVAQRQDTPSRLLARNARSVADLWNDPPHSAYQKVLVEQAFPELADALDELLGGGPTQ